MSTNPRQINRKEKMPIYQQIYTILKTELQEGIYNGQTFLPSEKELCRRFDVERNTVRKALMLLVGDHVIQKVPGSGSKILLGETESSASFPPAQMRRNILMITCETDPLGSQVEYFHLKLMQLLEQSISDIGYNLIFKVLNQNNSLEEIIDYTCPVLIIFDSYFPSKYYQKALALGIPAISVNHYTPLLTSIVSNNYDGAYQIAKKMTEAGHNRIALITGKGGYQTTTERLSGFQSLFYQKNLSLEEEYIFPGNWLFSSGYEITEKIMNIPKEQRPTAIFAFNDDIAYGCLSYLEKHGFDVPKDISLAGFDRSDRYEGMFRSITTVDVNIEAMVHYVCWCTDSILNGHSPKALAKIQIETSIYDGNTIGKVCVKS